MGEVFSAVVAGLFAVLVVLVQKGRRENGHQHAAVEERLSQIEHRLAAHVVWEENVKYVTKDDLRELISELAAHREVST